MQGRFGRRQGLQRGRGRGACLAFRRRQLGKLLNIVLRQDGSAFAMQEDHLFVPGRQLFGFERVFLNLLSSLLDRPRVFVHLAGRVIDGFLQDGNFIDTSRIGPPIRQLLPPILKQGGGRLSRGFGAPSRWFGWDNRRWLVLLDLL